jgi:hypothetical protein
MTFAQLARHFQDAEGCKALYDVEGRKLREVVEIRYHCTRKA